MQKQSVWGVVGLGALLILSAGISPAWGEINKLGGDERPVMEAVETASFGTEDWVPEIAPVGKKKSVLVARKKHHSVLRF